MTTLESQPFASISPFLRGSYAPVFTELDEADLKVTGEIPASLAGVYMRNGANPQFQPLGRYHWFDGDGMIHAVYLENGRARYKNKWIETPGLRHERKAGQALFGGILNFQFPPDELMAECGIFKNAANTNIIRHADKYLGLWEGGPASEISRELDTVGLFDFGGKLEGAFTAHPKWCPETGELIFFGYDPIGEQPFLRYHVADKNGNLTHSTPITIPKGVMMHDFLTTRNYSIFFDLPAVLEAVMAGESMWQPQLGARIGVMPRHGSNSDVRWFDIDPCYVFHFLNSWEETGPDGHERIVAFGCRMPRIDLDFEADSKESGGLVAEDGVGMAKWTIDLTTGTVKEEMFHDLRTDFPRLHDDLLGLKHRYGFASGVIDGEPSLGFNGIVRYDLETGAEQIFSFGEGTIIGEAVVADDPARPGELGAFVMVYATNAATLDTDFCIFDAADITSGPLARVHLPQRVPAGFHGNWMPA
jgi:carotenoid cleavage dioxygenase-like enzyme